MTSSNDINEIAKALTNAQFAFKFASKDSVNPHFKSRYADLASIIDAVKEGLAKNDLSISQLAGKDYLQTILMHSSGQWISTETPIFNANNSAQGYGAGLTYARRYAMAAICNIAQDDDDGNSDREMRIDALLDDAKRCGISSEQVDKILCTNDWHRASDTNLKRLSEIVRSKK